MQKLSLDAHANSAPRQTPPGEGTTLSRRDKGTTVWQPHRDSFRVPVAILWNARLLESCIHLTHLESSWGRWGPTIVPLLPTGETVCFHNHTCALDSVGSARSGECSDVGAGFRATISHRRPSADGLGGVWNCSHIYQIAIAAGHTAPGFRSPMQSTRKHSPWCSHRIVPAVIVGSNTARSQAHGNVQSFKRGSATPRCHADIRVRRPVPSRGNRCRTSVQHTCQMCISVF